MTSTSTEFPSESLTARYIKDNCHSARIVDIGEMNFNLGLSSTFGETTSKFSIGNCVPPSLKEKVAYFWDYSSLYLTRTVLLDGDQEPLGSLGNIIDLLMRAVKPGLSI